MVLFNVVCSITVAWCDAASPDKTLSPMLIQERKRQGREGDRENSNSKTLFYVLWYAKLLQLLRYYYY